MVEPLGDRFEQSFQTIVEAVQHQRCLVRFASLPRFGFAPPGASPFSGTGVFSNGPTPSRRNRTRGIGRTKDTADQTTRTERLNVTRRRIKTTMAEIDDNEDESIKALADNAFELEKFGWDIL